MVSEVSNGLLTSPLVQPPAVEEEGKNDGVGNDCISPVTARAAISDWNCPLPMMLPATTQTTTQSKTFATKTYTSIHSTTTNEHTILLAANILYEPSSMASLAKKLSILPHPICREYSTACR
mmetsp:Transcript_23632/g.42460  ORF Transcript_23632/g.42460 Transcript_23632/m.42460 type:complete len:122 (-) Transcript_23632:146-511(-)